MRWALNDGSSQDQAYADSVLSLLASTAQARAVVPSLWWLESSNALLGAEREGLITQSESETFQGLVNELGLDTDTNEHLRVSELTIPLARELKLSIYDAAYLALAIERNLPLASLDRDLTRAATRAGVALLTQR